MHATARVRLDFAVSGEDEILFRQLPPEVRAEIIAAAWQFLSDHYQVGRPFTEVAELTDYQIPLVDGRPAIDRAEIFDRLEVINQSMNGQLPPMDGDDPTTHWDIGNGEISCEPYDILAGQPVDFTLPTELLERASQDLQTRIKSRNGGMWTIQLRYSFHLFWAPTP